MEKTIKQSIVLLLMTIVLSSCGIDMFHRIEGNGHVITEERTSNEKFTAVKVSNGIDLFLKQGQNPSILVEADDNLQDIIITEVIDGRLKIYTKKNIRGAKAKKVFVTLDSLKKLTASSGSSVRSENILKVTDLEVSTSSGANLTIEVHANHLTTSSSSGSQTEVSGQTTTYKTSASSGSSIHAYLLRSQEVIAKASSGASLQVFAAESLNAKASSGGNISFKGTPEKVTKSTSSGGGVNSRGQK